MDTSSPQPPAQLSDHVVTLWANRWIVLATIAVFLVGAFGYAQTRETAYTSSADVLVGTGAVGAPDAPPDLDTEIDLAQSRAVAEIVLGRLPTVADIEAVEASLNVTRTSEGRVLRFTYSTGDRRIAELGAHVSATAYLSYRSDQIRSEMQARQTRLILRRNALEDELLLRNEVIASSSSGSVAAATARDEKERIKAQLEDIGTDLTDLTVLNLTAGQILGSITPARAVSTPLAGVLIAGGLMGLLLGCVIAFGVEGLRGRIRGSQEIERVFGAPVLGVVPYARAIARHEPRKNLEMQTDPEGAVTEAFRVLRSSVLRVCGDDARVILVTSGAAGEGKSTTACNLAVRIAGSGKQVLLVDADLRRPSLHQYFGIGNRNGLRHLLQDETRGLPISITGFPGLAVITSGPPTAASADHFEADSFRRVVERLRPLADYVVIDAPPIFVSDTVLMAPVVDGIVYIADAGKVTRRSLVRAHELLERLGLRAKGVVLNKYEGGPGSEFGYRPYRYETKERREGVDGEVRRPKRGSRRSRDRGDDTPGLREATS